MFKDLGVQIACGTKHTLENLLGNLKDKNENSENSKICVIICKTVVEIITAKAEDLLKHDTPTLATYINDHSKSEQLSHVICIWFTGLGVLQVSEQLTP